MHTRIHMLATRAEIFLESPPRPWYLARVDCFPLRGPVSRQLRPWSSRHLEVRPTFVRVHDWCIVTNNAVQNHLRTCYRSHNFKPWWWFDGPVRARPGLRISRQSLHNGVHHQPGRPRSTSQTISIWRARLVGEIPSMSCYLVWA